MRYDVSVNKGENLGVELTTTKSPASIPGTQQFEATLAESTGGDSKLVDMVGGGRRSLTLVNHRVVDPGRVRAIGTVVNERDKHAARARSGGTQEKTLRSPMPGRIVKVYVKAGDVVEVGASLLVVEAMKMENELRAKASAVVEAVLVSAGQTVEMNAVLLQLR